MKSKFWTFYHKILDGAYNIGFVEKYDLETFQVENIKWLDVGKYKDAWFADPFILDVSNSEIKVLAEEFVYKVNKGRISLLTIDKESYKLKRVESLLELDTHLSFPYIIKDSDDIYICPENAQNGSVSLYNLENLNENKTIINSKGLDTQIVKIDNKFYAFTVEAAGHGLEDTKKLKIYESDTILGEYRLVQEIENERCEERGAGTIFNYKGKLIRPAQICEGGYGKGVIFYEIKMEDGKFTETEIRRIMAVKKQKNGLCFHTFSVYENLVAVDGFDYVCRPLSCLAPILYGLKASVFKMIKSK